MDRSNQSPEEEGSLQPLEPKVLEELYFMEIIDRYGHILVLQGKTLIASPHEGMEYPIFLVNIPCRDESLEKGKGNPIYLGIAEHKLCLCCAESGGQPVLKLEEKNIMELAGADETEKSFAFYCDENGLFSTFESVAFPGWFICTSGEARKPIFMTNDKGKGGIHFYFVRNK